MEPQPSGIVQVLVKTVGKGEARTLTLKEMIRIRIPQALIDPSWEWNMQLGLCSGLGQPLCDSSIRNWG